MKKAFLFVAALAFNILLSCYHPPEDKKSDKPMQGASGQDSTSADTSSIAVPDPTKTGL